MADGLGEGKLDPSWWRCVLGRVARAVHDPHEAEDYLHSAFLRLQEYSARHEVRNPAAFLVRTAVNIAVDEKRKAQVRRGPTFTEIFDCADDQPLQSEALLAEERLKHVQAGLAKLSPRTREVFLMHRVEGLKYREIAAKLEISESGVEKHMAKASLFLTAWIEGW